MTDPHNGALRISDLGALFRAIVGFAPEEMHHRLEQAANATRDHWADLAKARLRRTAVDYDRGLQVLDVGPCHFAVVLHGKLNTMLERGAASWDLRRTVLLSPKAKVSKAGHLYLSVPYRHATPGTLGRVGVPMPKAIWDHAKRLRPTVSGIDAIYLLARLEQSNPALAALHMRRMMASRTRTLWGGIAELSSGRGRLPEGLAPIAKAHHATDLYAGMYRLQKLYAKAKQSTYMTFRTISTNPNTMRDATGQKAKDTGKPVANWIHPGFQGLHLLPMAATFAQQEAVPAALGWKNASGS